MINKKVLYIGEHTDLSKDIKKMLRKEMPSWLDESAPELIIVAGGDGSMLHAIQRFAHLNVPFYGIGAGTLNFLMNPIEGDVLDYIKSINFDKLDVVETARLKISVKRDGELVYQKEATNDIVIGNKVNQYHHMEVSSKNKRVSENFKGMGMIVSTPLGSTAMSFNNDVPVIPSLSLPVLAISSMISVRLSSFKKLVDLSDKLNIKLLTDQECFVLVDGSAGEFEIKKGDKIKISEGTPVKLAFEDYKAFEVKRANLF